jgi:hypothetical protein
MSTYLPGRVEAEMMVDVTSDSGRCGAPGETSIVINRLNVYRKRV